MLTSECKLGVITYRLPFKKKIKKNKPSRLRPSCAIRPQPPRLIYLEALKNKNAPNIPASQIQAFLIRPQHFIFIINVSHPNTRSSLPNGSEFSTNRNVNKNMLCRKKREKKKKMADISPHF